MTFLQQTATLSTGQRVDLPLRCEADVAGALFSADWRRLCDVVPTGLTPLRLGARTGGVVLAGISYRSVEGFDPYDEFAVIVPVACRTVAGLPRLDGGIGGYVNALPVTTEASCTMGREIWGFPKTVADIKVEVGHGDEPGDESDGDEWHVEVREGSDAAAVEGETPELSLIVSETRRHSRKTSLDSYTVHQGKLCRTHVDLLGPVGFGVGPGHVSLDVGTGPFASDVEELGIRRPLGRFSGRIRAHVQAVETVSTTPK